MTIWGIAFGVCGDVEGVRAGVTGDVGVVGNEGLIPGKIGNSIGAFGVVGRLWGGVRGFGESSFGLGGEMPGTVGSAKLGELTPVGRVGDVTGVITGSTFTSGSFFSTFGSTFGGSTTCGTGSGSFFGSTFFASIFSSFFSALLDSVKILPSL